VAIDAFVWKKYVLHLDNLGDIIAGKDGDLPIDEPSTQSRR
jgi:hypothetical protein